MNSKVDAAVERFLRPRVEMGGVDEKHHREAIRLFLLTFDQERGEETPPALICVGYETLRILAREGAIFNLVAADDLYGTKPTPEETPEMKAFVARAREFCEHMDAHKIRWVVAAAGNATYEPCEPTDAGDILDAYRALIESEERRP